MPPEGTKSSAPLRRAARLRRFAQRVVDQRTGGEHDHADAGVEQPDQVLAHRVVRGRLDHRLRVFRREQRPDRLDIFHGKLARERARARRGAGTAQQGHDVEAPQAGAARVLEHQTRDSSSADQGNAHEFLIVFPYSSIIAG